MITLGGGATKIHLAAQQGVPIELLDVFPSDAAEPALFLRETMRQFKCAGMSILQIHGNDGQVRQFDSRSADFEPAILGLASILATADFYALRVESPMQGKIPNVYREIQADTESLLLPGSSSDRVISPIGLANPATPATRQFERGPAARAPRGPNGKHAVSQPISPRTICAANCTGSSTSART